MVQGLFTSFLFKEKVWLKSVPLMSVRKGVMVQKSVQIIFVSKKRGYDLKRLSKVGNCLFGQHVPRVILKYHGPGACIFDYREVVTNHLAGCNKS